MNKFHTFFCTAAACFLLFSCDNPQMIHLLNGPSELEGLLVEAYDGNNVRFADGVSALDPAFSKRARNYAVVVPETSTRFAVKAVGLGESAIAYAESASGDFSFPPETDSLKISFTVTRKHMEPTDHTLTVYRRQPDWVKGITVAYTRGDGVTMAGEFNRGLTPGITDYIVNVPADTDSVTVTAAKRDGDERISVRCSGQDILNGQYGVTFPEDDRTMGLTVSAENPDAEYPEDPSRPIVYTLTVRKPFTVMAPNAGGINFIPESFKINTELSGQYYKGEYYFNAGETVYFSARAPVGTTMQTGEKMADIHATTVDGYPLKLRDEGEEGDKYEKYAFDMTEADVVLGGNWTPISNGPSNVRYVYEHGPKYDPDTSGTGNGLSWQTATGDLQAVMDDPDAETFEIWMTGGTYYPDWNSAIESGQFYINADNPWNRQNWTFRLRSRVTVYGGFAGTETAKDERDSGKITGSNETVLSGNDEKSGLQYLRPMTGSGSGVTGVRLTGVKVNDLTLADGAAAGIYINSVSNITLTNVTIRDNICTSPGSQRNGGGIQLDSSIDNVIFDGCTIRNNIAYVGGGLVWSNARGGDSVKMLNCTIMGNYATNQGGGINLYVVEGSPTFLIRQSRIVNNIAGGNASAIFNRVMLTMEYVEISGNRSITGNQIVYDSSSSLILDHCTVAGNYSAAYGGIGKSGGTMTVKNSVIWGNGTNVTQNSGTTTYTNSLVQNANPAGAGNLNGTGRESDYPQFARPLPYTAAPATGNYRLLPDSPLIGAASDGGNIGAYNSQGGPGPEPGSGEG